MVELTPLPDFRERVIVVGTSLRKPLVVLAPYFASLAAQELPPRTRLHFCFVNDFAPDQKDAEALTTQWIAERRGELLRGVPAGLNDFREGPATHEWTLAAMRRVGANKGKILQRTLALKADAVWLADADLIMDTTTLASLISCERPIVSAVYWTHWSKQPQETVKSYAGPQVWLRHPYLLDGRGMDEAEFRAKLVTRELTRVWGFGACTLIARSVLEAGVDFSPAPDFPQEGLWAGEDRQFCIKCERLHIEAWADPWPDIFHIYHLEDDVPQIENMARRFCNRHPVRAGLGDLVALRLQALEPIPVNNAQWSHLPPQFARGRLGQLPLMPEVEEAVYKLQRGEKTIVRIHAPLSHPAPFMRGHTRLIEVTLLDVKPFGAPPVVERELHIQPHSGAHTDTFAQTDTQRALQLEPA